MLSLGLTYRWLNKKYTKANLNKRSQIVIGGIAIVFLLIFITYLYINRETL